MDKLSFIFENPDVDARKAALSKLARSLNINMSKAKNEKGDIEENRLAVLIFEEMKTGRQRKRQRLILAAAGIFLFIFGCAVMYVVSHAVMSTTQEPLGIFIDEGEK